MSARTSISPRHAVDEERKPLRMQGWDFTSPGWYFLTICTRNMRPVFGTIVNGHMVMNAAGKVAEKFWCAIPEHFPRAIVDEHIVMPNHVHGLLHLTAAGWDINGHTARHEAFGKPVAGSVSTIMRSYKGAVSGALGERVWKGRFYEVRARDEKARANIRAYIRHNPENYDAVMNGGEPQYLGNKALLSLPKLGFLASRGQSTMHGILSIKPGEAIISGFLSPMEQAVFKAGLKHKRPMIWVLPAGLAAIEGATACRGSLNSSTACRGSLNSSTACRGSLNSSTACRAAIEEGRLLVLSPFDPALDAPNARRAAWCNQYVLEHCDRFVVGHLNPDGMLACILAEADPEKDAIHL